MRLYMNVLGGMMILGGCGGLGVWYRNQLVGRIETLRALTGILEMLMSEIRYGSATLPESCAGMAARIGEPYSSVLFDVYRQYGEVEGESFAKIFCEKMAACLSEAPVTAKDKDIFLQPFRTKGFQDCEMQLACFAQSTERLRESIRLQERELLGKCRLAVSIGVMCGLLVIVVLL